MGFTFEEFPNSDYYNSDLREILKYMREFETTITGYQEIIDELKNALDTTLPEMQSAIKALELATSDLDDIRQDIIQLRADVNDNANNINEVWNVVNRLEAKVNNWENDLALVYRYIDTKTKLLETDFNTRLYNLRVAMNTKDIELQKQIDELRERVEYLIRNLSYDVFNPIDKKRISFDKNNAEVYVDLRDYGMSYGELAARQFTYGQIRDAKWGQRLFSTKGRRYVTHSATWSHSPLSGRWESWPQALSHVLGFCVGSLTNAQFASREYTNQDIEDMGLTFEELILLGRGTPPTGDNYVRVGAEVLGLTKEEFSKLYKD